MRTISTIPVGPNEPTLYVDVLMDPPTLAIRRTGGGLVHIEAGELDDLIRTLVHVAGEIAASGTTKEKKGGL